MPEVLAYVLNGMMKTKNRNVLRFGYLYSDKDGDVADPFKFHGVITQSSAFVHSSDLWRKVNQRLGTDLTQHLLRNCAIFTVAPPTCLFQVCGVPIYDLISAAHTSSRFLLCRPGPGPQSAPVSSKAMISKRQSRRRRKLKSQEVTGKRKRKREDEMVSGDVEGLPRKRSCSQPAQNTCESPALSHLTSSTDSAQPSGRNSKTTQSQVVNRHLLHSTQSQVPSISTTQSQAVNRNVHVSSQSQVAAGSASATTTATISPGSRSWKPADQSHPQPSKCFIRMLRVLYGGAGIRSFLLNRKWACGGGAGGSKRRLQGADLVRLVFLQGEGREGQYDDIYRYRDRKVYIVPFFLYRLYRDKLIL